MVAVAFYDRIVYLHEPKTFVKIAKKVFEKISISTKEGKNS